MLRSLLGLFLVTAAFAQPNPSWSRPYPGHKIAGNLYYVGTEDLACFLLTSPEGHILINTGLSDSAPMIRESMRQLGFKTQDIRILLAMQSHYDHVAAMAEIKKISGAKLLATEADAPVIEDGGKSDPYLSGQKFWFTPVKVDRRIKDGEIIKLGGTEVKVIPTPGHTPGSVSYATTVMEGGRKRSVLIANMGSVVMPLVGNAKYPQIVQDFERAFATQKKLTPKIWVAAHASQYGMEDKRKAGSFVDPKGYLTAVDTMERKFREALAKETKEHK